MKPINIDFPGGGIEIGSRPLLMGVVNATPDSFSDGGECLTPEQAVERALAMIADGADLIDVGGESTRPGAREIPVAEEIQRIRPVVEAIARHTDVPISIDTRKSAVAHAAIEAGARIVNDVSGFHFDEHMVDLVRETGVGYIGMHMRGTPETMQSLTDYGDIMRDVLDYFKTMFDYAAYRGVPRNRLIVDPGIGFGKTVAQNLTIIRHLDQLHSLDRPVLVGASRKSFIGKVLGIDDPKRREWGHAAVAALAVYHGAAILRVHDIRETRQVADMAAAIRDATN